MTIKMLDRERFGPHLSRLADPWRRVVNKSYQARKDSNCRTYIETRYRSVMKLNNMMVDGCRVHVGNLVSFRIASKLQLRPALRYLARCGAGLAQGLH